MENNSAAIFFKGSKTYFTSSLFFPKKVREDVFTLYAFVRIADNYVDQAKQDPKKISEFTSLYEKAISGKKIDNEVITNFVELSKRKGFEKEWIDSFLKAMIQDTTKTEYKTLKQTIDYMYGSAEVIGLMMNRVMGIGGKADKYARSLGRAMQYANFLRDIDEDNTLGRQYVPTTSLKKYGLKNLYKQHVMENKEAFEKLMKNEIKNYEKWQKEAEKGFKYIPKRYLIAIKTASDMYKWTVSEINKNPLIVFETKVKPSRFRIIFSALKNAFGFSNVYKTLPYVYILNHIAH